RTARAGSLIPHLLSSRLRDAMNPRRLLALPVLLAAFALVATVAAAPQKRTFAGAGPNQRVNSAAHVVLFGTGRSLDGRPIRFSWRQISGPAVVLHNANHSTARFRAPRVDKLTELQFELTVTDTLGGTGTSVVKVTVEPPKGATSVETQAAADAAPGANTPNASETHRYRIRE